MANFNTPRCILSFPHLFEPKEKVPGGEPVYSASFLFDAAARKTPEWRALQQAYLDALKAKHPKLDPKNAAENPFRDGAQKDYAGYGPGIVYISASSKQQPPVKDRRLQLIMDASLVYAGAIVIASLSPYGWEFSGRKGASFGLTGLQLVDGKAPRIDGRSPPSFSPIEDLEDDDAEAF